MSGRFSPSHLARAALAWLPRQRQTAQLRESEARFRSLTELSSDFFWETDAEHRYTLIELGWGYAGVRNNSAKLGVARWDIAYASPDEAAWAAHRAAIAARERFVDFRFSRIEEGEERFYEHSGEPHYDARKNFLGYRGVGRDVTARKRAEEALRESEARKSAMFETALDCIVTIDHEGRVVEFNPAAERTFGYRRAEAMGKELAELIIPPRLRARHRQGLARYLKGGPGPVLGTRSEMPAVRADGHEFPVELTVTRIATQSAPLFTAYLRDITERKRSEEALRESQQRYERAMVASNAGLWEWDARKDEYYCSPRHLELLGFPPGTRFSGREDFLRRVPFHPEDLERWQQAQRQLFASGGSYLVMDLRVIGSAETRWVRVNALCFRDSAGTVLRWTGSVTDVTEAKRAEEGLRSSEDRYALAMEAAGDGHTDWNLQTGEHYISPRLLQICGYAPGTTFRDRAEWVRRFPFHPEDRPKWEQAVAAHFAGRESHFKMELRIVVRGEVRWTAFHFLSTRDAAGAPIRWTGSIGDITEQKRTEEALRLSESRYAGALEAAEEGHFDVKYDTNEHFYSDRLYEIVGIAPGTRFANRVEALKQMRFYGSDAEIYLAGIRAVEARNGPERYEFEFRIVRPSGEMRWLRTRGKVSRDAEGNIRRRTGVAVDITEAKLAEQALRESQERFALAVAGSDDGIWDVDFVARRVFLSARARELTGLPPGPEMVPLDEFQAMLPLHPDDVPRRNAAMQAHLEGKAPAYEGEFRLRQLDGVYRWRRIHGVCVRDANGRPQRLAGSFSDVDARRRAEDALRASEERYSLAMEASEEGYVDVNVDTDEFVTSERLNEIFGIARGTRFANRADFLSKFRFYGTDAEIYAAAMRTVAAKDGPNRYEFEFRIVRPSGEVRWLWTRGQVTRDAEGRARRRIGVVADITARKEAEEARRLSEERYALAMGVAEEGHLDWNVQTDEFFASSQARRVLNVPQDAECRTRHDMMARVPYHPDDAPRVSAAWSASLAGRAAEHEMEFRILRGEEVRWIRRRWKIFRGADGAPQRVIGVVSDITERRQAVETLRASESRFRALTELSSDAYWVQDENLRFLPTGSKNDLAGYPSDAHVGKTRWELSNAAPLSGTWAEHEAVLQARETFRDFEYRRLGPDGAVRYLSISGAPMFDDQGRFRGYQGVGRDITGRKRAEEEVRESEARFRRMTELSADTYWEQDENFRYTRTGTGHDIAGYDTDVNQGRTRWEMCGEVTPLSGSWQEHQAVLAAHQPFQDFEYRRRRPDGTMGYYSASGAPMFDAEGRFTGYQGVARDITEFRRVEDDLRQSESRFRTLTELSSDWYWQQDEELRFTYVSQQLADSTKYPQDSVIGKRRWEMPTITPLSSTWAEHQAVLAARQAFRDFEYVGQGGEDKGLQYVSISGAPIFDQHGNFRGYQGTGRNITERKRIEEELRSRQEMLELAQKSAGAVAFEWRIGADGLYRNRSSPELAAMYGVPQEAFDGSFERWKKLIHPPDWPAVKEAIKHALRTGDVATEYRVVHPDGSVHWLHAKGRMFFGADGKPVRMLGFMQDVTERKRVEEALRQSEERFALAVAGSNEGIFDWDLVSDRMYMSQRAQELFGLPLGELWRPRPQWRSLVTVYPDDAGQLRQVLSAHIAGEAPYDAEFRVCMPDGSIRWFRQRGIALRDASGKAYRMVGSIGDVTEKHKAEEELRSLERQLRQAQRLEAMGTLAGGIAHDFNNILGAILGYGEMALRDAPGSSRLRRDLDSIIIAGERGRALIDRILAFSRSGVADRVPVHVEKLVREALNLVSAKLPPNVTLHAKLHAGCAAVLGDPTQVHQVLMNLATNAIQAMPAGGTLRVHLDALRIDTARVAAIGMLSAADYLALKVADTGTGIAPAIMERIFDPFFTTKEVGTGTGLGLSLVHGIVSDLGGAIDVASTVGAGSTFTVYLPRSGDAVDKSEDEEPEMPRGEGQRVLVVDDEEPLVRLATRTLEELGYAPVGFTSSTAALAAFRADPKRFDAVITDERMPGLSGSALIREVRGIRGGIPIVLMSGFVGAAVARQARTAGAEEVLKKPLSARDLAASLARVLHPRQEA